MRSSRSMTFTVIGPHAARHLRGQESSKTAPGMERSRSIRAGGVPKNRNSSTASPAASSTSPSGAPKPANARTTFARFSGEVPIQRSRSLVYRGFACDRHRPAADDEILNPAVFELRKQVDQVGGEVHRAPEGTMSRARARGWPGTSHQERAGSSSRDPEPQPPPTTKPCRRRAKPCEPRVSRLPMRPAPGPWAVSLSYVQFYFESKEPLIGRVRRRRKSELGSAARGVARPDRTPVREDRSR